MRLSKGGLIDRSETFEIRFDGRRIPAHPGDTVASALLAAGERLVARSFKHHRPRGIFSAGAEEPNALVGVGRGSRHEPNVRATVQEARPGLRLASQNRWPLLSVDAGAAADLAKPLLGAGFYYKTFMWPKAFWEKVYEPLIRNAAGLGRLSGRADPDPAEKRTRDCDLLVIGAGPAGLMAAREGARAGLRVVLAEEDFLLGGRLLAERETVGGVPGAEWAEGVRAELESLGVRVMARTAVFGVYDHGLYGALERGPGGRATLWRVHARRAVLAAGAIERPVAFEGNDRPGVMLAGAARAYLNRWAVAPGRKAVVFGAGDDAWRTAEAMAAAGLEAVIADARPVSALGPAPEGVKLFAGTVVSGTRGRLGLREVRLRSDRGERWVQADLLAASGGWSPSVHLSCHHRGRPVWDAGVGGFVPGADLPPGMSVAGAATGAWSTHAALRQGVEAGRAAAEALGASVGAVEALPEAEDAPRRFAPLFLVHGAGKGAYVDLQNDVTVADVRQAEEEGFGAVEHLKRYTTLGMATDQGKTGNVLGLAALAQATGVPMGDAGTTIYRPPWTPVPISAFGGDHRGEAYRPARETPSHAWAAARRASFVDSGAWKRAEWYVRGRERGWRDSVDREAALVREAVGICDVSTLGKIDVQGPDAAAFLDFVYANMMSSLAVGRCRYGLMLREDGFVFDDGTVARLGETHFLVTTTTANAGAVMRWMEFVRQGLRPDWDVTLISATDQWAQVAVAGPRSRTLLERVVAEDVSDAALPFMGWRDVTVGGVAGRVFRISFSGELAYELAVPARYGGALMERLMEAGADLGVAPYGTEALGVLRIEKGHAAGAELDGRTTAGDLGLGRMLSKKKDFLGRALAHREGLTDCERPALVGLRVVGEGALSAGAHLFAPGAGRTAAEDQGWVSSVAWSPAIGGMIGLGFLARGAERMGETVTASDPVRGRETDCEVVSPHFVDPDGERLRG